MTSKNKKNVFGFFTLIIMLVILLFLINDLTKPKQSGVLIHFFDVGQGDATLVEMPQGQKVLIDGGPNDSITSKIDAVIPFYRREIDAIVLTHPHADHSAGLIKVIDTYEVKGFYLTGALHTAPEYLQLLESLKEKKIPVHEVVAGDYLDFGGGIKLSFLYPKVSLKGQKVENLNNTSIVTKLNWGKSSTLFMGDLEKENQSQLLKDDIEANLLKVSHHCSSDAVNSVFLKQMRPKYSVIFVGKDNKFGHPSLNCLNALKGTEMYRTDKDGDINFIMTQSELKPI